MTPEQRLVWERRIGTIGVAYTEKYVAEVLDELARANPLRFECPWCECKWKFHTQAQLDMIQRHMNAHQNAAVQAAVGSLSAMDRAE